MTLAHRIILIAAFTITTLLVSSGPVITFFFWDYPANAQDAAQLSQKLSNPKKLASHGLRSITQTNNIAGIFTSYFGYIQASDNDGQVIFPRKQSKSQIDVFITNKITPIVMFENTVSHWELQPGVPAKRYLFTFTEDDATKQTFWDVQEKPLPENNYIAPTESLIIIAKPDNIYVPLGITITPRDGNLILPNFYVKKGIQSTINALYMLHMTHYFRPVDNKYKKAKKRYGQMINEY